MAFPTLAPTSRQYTGGDWPVAKFQSQNGSEARILYGNRRVGHTLSLSYNNITDTEAESFFTDYESRKGTYEAFALPQPITGNAGKGWAGTADFFKAGPGVQWRYAEPPQLTSVYPGVSSVTIKLVAVGRATTPTT